MKIYISGKIGNLDMADVRAKFDAVDTMLTAAGHQVLNPLDIHDHPHVPVNNPSTWAEYMVNDIAAIFDCVAIYMLHDWQDSPGARIEHAICKEMGKQIFYAATDLI